MDKYLDRSWCEPRLLATIDLSSYATVTNLQIRFRGETGSSFESDMAIDAIKIDAAIPLTSCAATIITFPYFEGFETGLGFWRQEINDDFDWAINSGGTTSTGTGPSSAAEGRFYAYTEASNPNSPTKVAILISPCFDLTQFLVPTTALPILGFNYHMYGTSVGSLELEMKTDTTSWTTIWSRTGDQGDQWLYERVNLQAYMNFTDVQFRFKGTTGSFSSDIAIDACKVESWLPVGTTDISTPTTILDVMPNPFKNYLSIRTNIAGELPYQIVNVHGQTVQVGQVIGNTSIDVAKLSTGVYFIHFNNEQEKIVKRLIKY